MRSRMIPLLALFPLALGAGAAHAAEGDVLLVDRVRAASTMDLPARGLTMGQVEARWGSPGRKLDPRGGQKAQWPVINRWTYPEFTVYFERDRVIDAVANKADPAEIGPKPAR